jgi:diguanylate cyclase (GGDEF)-like protein/putative nucleotidyltransferase with HDIG domain
VTYRVLRSAERTASEDEPRERGATTTLRLLTLVAPVTLAGAITLAAAAATLIASRPSAAVVAGLLVLLAASALAEAYPVPVESLPAGSVSLAAVFIVGAAVIYGWAPAALIACAGRALVDFGERRPLVRLVYNGAVYALGGAAAGVAVGAAPAGTGVLSLTLAVVLGAAAFYVVNVLLVAAVIARWAGERFAPLLVHSGYSTAIPFAIMASVSLLLAVLWRQSPLFAPALVGPLIAIALYQRSVHSALRAMRLALTDQLTGLGNHRHFHESLQRCLEQGRDEGFPVSLCLLDLDDFKHINDRYGHPVGDELLAEVATFLRSSGEAFRVGGDEFALLLPHHVEEDAVGVAETVIARLAAMEWRYAEQIAFSAGVATFPRHGTGGSELVRVTDAALYRAKAGGKNRVELYRAELPDVHELRTSAPTPDLAARLAAAEGLAHAVGARDPYTGGHSQRVAELAERIARRLGLDEEQADLIRLAGGLHDLGKLAIPEEILGKEVPLTAAERGMIEKHPEIAFRMLQSLRIEPVAAWILHHHERWDGGGYPGGLSGERIPLASRILFVADVFDALTTDRAYGSTLSHEDALDELERNAGSQFDPRVVAACLDELGRHGQPMLAAVAG